MGHPDRPVFDLIAAVLSGPHGMAGQAVAASGASASVAADFRVIHTYRFGSPGAFNLVAHAETDDDLAAVERALLHAVADLREGRIDSAALERAHKRLRVEWAEFLDNPQELAFPGRPPSHDEPLERAARPHRGEGRGNGGRRAAGRSEVLRAL